MILETANLKIYTEEKGTGEPVLFIGGTGGDLRIKPNVLDGPLARHHRVITYDQRGLGQTEKPNGPYTMAQYADDAAALLSILKLSKVDVVGVSFGGMVAQHLAIRHPSKIRKLVLCCTSSGGNTASYPFHELPEDITPVQRLLKLMPISDRRRGKAWQDANPDTVKKLITETENAAISDHKPADYQRGAILQIEARKDHDTNDALPKIHLPTLICAGRYDGIAPPENQTKLNELISDSRLNWYEGGHMFMVQDKNAWKDIIAYLNS